MPKTLGSPEELSQHPGTRALHSHWTRISITWGLLGPIPEFLTEQVWGGNPGNLYSQ